MSEPSILTLDPVPREVRVVRQMTWGPKPMLLECSHPQEYRRALRRDPRFASVGRAICALCKGDDFSRSCMFVAVVPPSAIPAPQASLF